MSFLLDTNVVSELRKPLVDRRVRDWVASVRGPDLYLSVLTVGEVRQGIERLRSRDLRTAGVFEAWLATLLGAFADRILPISVDVAQEWGRLNGPQPLPPVDGLLAATALVHDLTLVTRNTRHVRRTGVRLFDPFGDATG